MPGDSEAEWGALFEPASCVLCFWLAAGFAPSGPRPGSCGSTLFRGKMCFQRRACTLTGPCPPPGSGSLGPPHGFCGRETPPHPLPAPPWAHSSKSQSDLDQVTQPLEGRGLAQGAARGHARNVKPGTGVSLRCSFCRQRLWWDKPARMTDTHSVIYKGPESGLCLRVEPPCDPKHLLLQAIPSCAPPNRRPSQDPRGAGPRPPRDNPLASASTDCKQRRNIKGEGENRAYPEWMHVIAFFH